MKILDMIKISQSNLVRSKLRTFLTILAVFIGTFTISLTNGVGNGVKSYVNKELGNVGVENSLIVQGKSGQQNPLSSEVTKYDPDKRSGTFNLPLLGTNDIENIRNIKNVQTITPNYTPQLEYIAAGGDKYIAALNQYIRGLNLDMASGRVAGLENPDEVSIPIRYVEPLGFSSASDALGKNLTVGYKNSLGKIEERQLQIVGVQQESILGNATIYTSPIFASELQADQTRGIANLSDSFNGLIVEFDKNLPPGQVEELKQTLVANGYSAQTIQDQIGTFSKIINGILVGLDVFGAIALLAATFGIVNTLLMAVNERTPEIGLMKALGANSRSIFSIFSLEAASIGFWGGLIGIALSVATGQIINHYAAKNFLKDFVGFNLLSFPVLPSLLTLAGIVLLAFLAGALPSLKASRLDPIKALRYE
ncbi:MAG: ABC transporter permease [Candidatus Doudnabacteria bacterium]|nr:ABC transporter permease [Candidatus Doudnabacteria bacterium]